jgi:hypothetical protein
MFAETPAPMNLHESPKTLGSIKRWKLETVYHDDGYVCREGEEVVGEAVYSDSHSLFRTDAFYMNPGVD